MRYVQTLRIINGLKWLAICLASLYAFIVLIAASTGFLGHMSKLDDPNFEIPLPALFALAGFVTSVLMSRFGRTLAEENEDNLAVTWTRPASREKTVLAMLGVDALGVLGSFALVMTLAAALIATFQVTKYVVAPIDTLSQLVRFIVEPLAFYALVMAVTASAKSAGRTLLGWTWVSLIFLGALASAPVIPDPWHRIFNLIDLINPLAYGSYQTTKGSETINVIGGPGVSLAAHFTPMVDIAALAIIFVIGISAALVQWRRLEA